MAEAPWLDIMRERLGTKEVAGKGSNPAILQMFADVGHPEIDEDATAWCAACAGSALKACQLPIPPTNVNLLARSYCTYGKKCEPKPGAIAIWPRGKSTWQGHVNIVEDVRVHNGKTQVKCIGGNQSNAVTRTGWTNVDGALDFRWPIKPTVEDLRQAGSSDIAAADKLKLLAGATTAAASGATAVSQAVTPKVPDVTIPQATEQLTVFNAFLDAATAIGTAIGSHPWIAAAVFVSIGGYWLAKRIEKKRIERAKAGHALSSEAAA